MAKDFDFNSLFIYDIANNHQGDVEHGLNIIKGMGNVTKKAGIRAALKFQFRHLDTFIHPDYKGKKDIKHIPRFISTGLSSKDYQVLTDEVKKQGMISMATPFDEESVDMLLELEIELIKVASCSAMDRPLLERISEINKPVVISTAGLSVQHVDRLVSFFEHKRANFALMHCVALYPTPDDKLHLNHIGYLRSRFPHVPIGFSTHEHPDNYSIIGAAYATGARLFERHVGMETKKHKLNAYSSGPDQIAGWIKSYQNAVRICGGEHKPPASTVERASLDSLKRGVYAKTNIKKGKSIKRKDVFFAMPLQKDQLNSGEWWNGITAERDYSANAPISNQLANLDVSNEELVYRTMLQVKGMLNNARIFIGSDSSIEISSHYGLERFREFGAVIITCINREYCKKLIIQLPRQKHPYHYHEKKEETFQLLHGDLEVEHEGECFKLDLGDTFLVKPNEWHKFHTLDGAIFEEVSTTHYNNDSFYEDDKIARLPREKRKIEILNWEAALKEQF